MARKALRRHGDLNQAGQTEVWLDDVAENFGAPILRFGPECVQRRGRLLLRGPDHAMDKPIAPNGLISDARLPHAIPQIGPLQASVRPIRLPGFPFRAS